MRCRLAVGQVFEEDGGGTCQDVEVNRLHIHSSMCWWQRANESRTRTLPTNQLRDNEKLVSLIRTLLIEQRQLRRHRFITLHLVILNDANYENAVITNSSCFPPWATIVLMSIIILRISFYRL